MIRRLKSLFVLAGVAAALAGPVAAADMPAIAVAANMQFAAAEIARAFTTATGKEVKLTFGSTGNFVQQIRQGAPFELLLAADEKSIVTLASESLAESQGRVYATGQIVVFAPKGSPVTADGALEGLKTALETGKVTKFAIAKQALAPYGKAAEEALRHAGLWDAIEPKLVYGDNIGQTAQFAVSGSTEGGIFALSLALAPELADKGSYAPIPADWHAPINQRMALLKGAGATARAFFDFMDGPAARAVLIRSGYGLPGGAS